MNRFHEAIAIAFIWTAAAVGSYFTNDTMPFLAAFWAMALVVLF